jgi:glycosyltransferase involved in cell wall biosynthesis
VTVPDQTRSDGRAPLSVVQVVPSLCPGGTERLVIEITKKLRSRFPVSVCCLDAPGEWASELTSLGVSVHALRRDPGFHPSLGLQIAQFARANKDAAPGATTVLHCHQYSPFVYGQIASWSRLGALRMVFTEHGRLNEAPPSRKQRLVNPWLARAGQLYAVSHELRDYMVTAGFPSNRLGVIYNGIDPGPEPTPEARDAARRLLNLPADRFVLGSVARMDPVKNFPAMLRAFARFHGQMPHSTLVLVGGGPEFERLKALTRELGVAGAVLFTGSRNDARSLLPAFDVYVNSSVTEGLSVTILEAMAAGLPVIATNVGGTPEVVEDNRTGLLVPPKQEEALAAAFTRLEEDTALAYTLGRTGRRLMLQRFTVDRMVADYVRAYHGEEKVAG